jgi:hypothetical protein
MATVTVSFTLDTRRDKDLVAWLERQPERQRSAAIREALRAHLSAGVSLVDVYQAVIALDRKLARGVRVSDPDTDDDQEKAPPDVLAALDNLGL